MPPSSSSLEALARAVSQAARLTVMTGAGVSAASGVPTFRGPEGLWRQFRPEDLATADAFRRDPRLVWEWYAWRRDLVKECTPNPAHHVLARWSEERRCRVVTQNVDDLHVRAGTSNLVRLHGSLWNLRCASTLLDAGVARRSDGGRDSCHHQWRDETVPFSELPPRCPRCGALARPDIVWFGEPLQPRDVEAAMRATRCDLFIAIGTSALVHPAAGFLVEARHAGAVTAEINPLPTPMSGLVDHVVPGRAEEVLVALDLLLRR